MKAVGAIHPHPMQWLGCGIPHKIGKLIALGDSDVRVGSVVKELADEARTALATPQRLFVSVTTGGIFDVSSETNLDVEVYVIDETRSDNDAHVVSIDAEDGTSFEAGVKRMVVTGPHFDIDQVVEAADGAYANGTKI